MKVSISPKNITSPESEDRDIYTEPKNTKENESQDVQMDSDEYISEKKFGQTNDRTDSSEEIDALDQYISFFKGNEELSSSSNFAEVKVPEIEDILSDPRIDIQWTETTEFYDLLKTNYIVLKDKINQSIKKLEEAKEKVPSMSKTYMSVIKERKTALRKIDEELSKIAPLKASIKDRYQQELDNLKLYGQEYYKYEIGEIEEKPDPSTFVPPLDLNGDNLIGDPETTLLAIGEAVKDGVTVYDVINKDTEKPVSFDEMGNVTESGSVKNANYKWTAFNENIEVVPTSERPGGLGLDEADSVLRLTTSRTQINGNGRFNAPIDMQIPEYVWVHDETGEFSGFQTDGDGNIISVPPNTENYSLRKVLEVRVTNSPTIHGDGDNHVIELRGDKDGEGTYGKLAEIHILGPEDSNKALTKEQMASGNYAISLNGGSKDDIARRVSGIHIDATTMATGADFTISDSVRDRIKNEYGVTEELNSDQMNQFNESFKNINNGRVGLLVSGFHNVGGHFSFGNDIILLEEMDEDAPEEYKDDLSPPLRTDVIKENGGYNAIFHKKGDVLAENVGLFWGGSRDDRVQLNVSKRHNVFVRSDAYGGLTEIGNVEEHNPDPDKDYGIKDDTYIVPDNVAFAQWYEEDVYDTLDADQYGIPDRLTQGTESNSGTDSNDWESLSLASTATISENIDKQYAEHLDALKDQEAEREDGIEDRPVYTWSEPFMAVQEEMNAFFGGWNAYVGNLDNETIPGFDTVTEG